jgi:hypothetical protein
MKRGHLGIAFVFAAFLLILFNTIITGAVVGFNLFNPPGFIAIVLFIIGLILMSKQSKLEKSVEDLKRGVITDPLKLKQIANRLGYGGRQVKEGYEVLDYKGRPLTVIPHNYISNGTYMGIKKSLLTGESTHSNRRRRYTR